MHVLAAFDKFKGTATAADLAAAVGAACWEHGHDCTELALADGGDGLLDVLGGANRTSRVTGPLGTLVEAPWRLHRGTAVIEMAAASGLALVGGAEHNDALDATTAGTGELIAQAISSGARRVIVGLGGSATTDGGLGALQAIGPPARLAAVELLVACDVETRFVDAARVFAPQKGATPSQVRLLTGRLEQLAGRYRDQFGVDVTGIPGSGAAGGLGGALAAVGGELVAGFDLVAEETGFDEALEHADLVITGEGRVDATSFDGKVVGGVLAAATALGIPVAAIAGSVDATDLARRVPDTHAADVTNLDTTRRGRAGADRTGRRGFDEVAGASCSDPLPIWSLVARFGAERAMREPLRCVELLTAEVVAAFA